MGAAQSIPVVGEIVTVVDAGARTIAAGVCEVVGDSEDAGKLIQGAGNSLKHYADVNLIVANTRVVVAKVGGDEKTADYLMDKEKEAWTEVAENTPVVGHVVGLVRYVEGDKAGGDRAMMAATRSTLVAGAAILMGGAAAAPVAALTGLAADGLMTAANSVGKHEFAPVGTFAGVAQAAKSGSVNDWVSAVEIPVGDAVAGALEGGVKTRFSARNPLSGSNSGSLLDNYTRFTEVADAAEQIPLQELRNANDTAGIVREYESPADALGNLEHGHTYDFVRLANGTVRAVTHEDARRATESIQGRGFVGHSSLVEPGTEVVAAGEIALNQEGIVTNINCRSGHFRVPFEVMADQMGRVFPRSVLTFESPTFAGLFGAAPGRRPINIPLPGLKKIAIYSPTLLIFVMTHNREPVTLQNAPYTVAFHEKDRVKMIGLADQSSAQTVYDEVPNVYAKALVNKREARVLSTSGNNFYVQQCQDEALKLKTFTVTRGLDLTIPLHDARYIVAFHRKDCVKMIGCPNEELARKAYNAVSPDLAKILFDRRHREILSIYGGSQWTTQCQDYVQNLPALDETAPLDAASWVVAWHQWDSVKAIGFQTAESAQAMYDVISTDWAKVLGDREHSQISKSYGWGYVAPCTGAVSLLNDLGDAALVQHAPYVVVLHQGGHVRAVGFSKEETGRMFYNAASTEWARILFDRRHSQVLLSYGGDQWVERCKAQVLQLPALQEADIPYGPYLVVFHQRDCVKMIALATEGSAQAVYDGISKDWAKSLIDRRRGQSLVSYGSNFYIQKCQEAALELNRLQATVPLHSAQFVVAYHQTNRVRLIGFDQQTAAQGVYNAISKDWAKIVINRRDSKLLESYGSANYIKQCEDEVQRLVSLGAPSMPM